jgi:uncharacterized YccA/Bax inhibitor family protein
MASSPAAIQNGVASMWSSFLIASTPASLATVTAREDSYAVAGAIVGDAIIAVMQILPAIALVYSGGRVATAGNVLLQLTNQSAGALVPTPGTLKIAYAHI